MSITPLILAGGSGTRLWPVSRKSYPKQFSKLFSGKSLFQMTVLRNSKNSNEVFGVPTIVTNDSNRFIVMEQLEEIGVTDYELIVEPFQRNTSAALLAGTLNKRLSPTDIILAVPCDHLIKNQHEYENKIMLAADAAKNGDIVALGVSPSSPHTGYGYLHIGDDASVDIRSLKSFVEKPTLEAASEYVRSGEYLWNSGIFLFSKRNLTDAFRDHLPNTLEHATKAYTKAKRDLNFLRLDAEHWETCDDISIDYGIMEKISNIAAVKLDLAWSDLGDWVSMSAAISDESSEDNIIRKDCLDTFMMSTDPDQIMVGIGLSDILAISTGDAVLICNKSSAQGIGDVVKTLRSAKVKQADSFPIDHRPWGYFESLSISKRFQVKRIVVNVGAALSLQSHHHRSEHWIVVEGTANVTVNETAKLVTEGESLYIPLGAVHRLENPGKIPLVLIEVQTGPYLGEDDIIRYEDQYSRS